MDREEGPCREKSDTKICNMPRNDHPRWLMADGTTALVLDGRTTLASSLFETAGGGKRNVAAC